MDQACCVVLCTCPDPETARSVARALVEGRVAACVNVLPGVSSVYRWEGRVEQDDETLLVIKTARDRYPDLEREIRTLHPYEIPEIVALPVERGLPAYLQWVVGAVAPEPSAGPDR